jgi:hypothetical protein
MHITAYGVYRCDLAQLIQDLDILQISCVHDDIASLQEVKNMLRHLFESMWNMGV